MGRTNFARRSNIRTFLVAFAAVILVVLIGGCGSVSATSSGPAQTATRDVQGFDSVEFSSAGTLTIEQTGTDSLEIRAPENILPSLTSEVAGMTLRLGVKPGLDIRNANDIAYRVTVAGLKGLVVSGAGTVTVTRLDGVELSVGHGGAARVAVSGRVISQVVDLSGIGEYDGSALESQNADVTVSGAGKVVVNASRTLHARVTGVGSVEYVGNPAVTKEVSGLGEIRHR